MAIEIDLSGRVALVTGGSRGLGRADALALARAGADVVIADLLVESDESAEAAESVGGFALVARSQGLVHTEETAETIRGLGRRALALKCDVTDREQLDGVLEEVDEKIGLDRVKALHVNDSKEPLGSNRDRHDNVGEGLMGDKLGVFLSHPALQGLPAVLEVPGTDGRGPDRKQVQKLKRLHKKWMAK